MTSQLSDKKIALVHDYLREWGGAERVLITLKKTFPQADVFTAFIDEQAMGEQWREFASWSIKTTWLQNVPLIKKIYSPLRFLAPMAFRSLDLSKYDLVISSSNAYQAKAVNVPNGVHICYCHTPPRSLYGMSTMTDWKKNFLFRFFGGMINIYMKRVDHASAQKVDHFIANSHEVQKRIKKYYGRDSVVINPPVHIPSQLHHSPAGYYLYVNRLALAKHPELAVSACTKLGVPLKVVGQGPMMRKLINLAGPKIDFLGQVNDTQLNELYSGAKALLYPVEDEDFGIVPIEAMGRGVPVIAHGSGGPLETIKDNVTGVFFNKLSVEGLIDAIEDFENKKFDEREIYREAQKYDENFFSEKIVALIKAL